MNLVLEMESSLEFWRRVYPLNRAPQGPVVLPRDEIACSGEDVSRLAPKWMTPQFLAQTDGRIHALAFSRELRRNSSRHMTHTWSHPLPVASFYQLNSNLFVCSPEYSFLAAASVLDFASLVALGDELCGLYSFDASASRGFRQREIALTSKAQLAAYVSKAGNCPGCDKAEAALGHIVDFSASPMETFDEMTISLPYHRGGYCVPAPEMNLEIPLNAKAARIAKQATCRADLCWRDLMLVIEHLGQYDHARPDRMISDRARTNALREMGFEVIELTGSLVGDLTAYEYIVQHIAARHGKRIKPQHRGALPQRVALRNTLFRWNDSYGAVRSRD